MTAGNGRRAILDCTAGEWVKLCVLVVILLSSLACGIRFLWEEYCYRDGVQGRCEKYRPRRKR